MYDFGVWHLECRIASRVVLPRTGGSPTPARLSCYGILFGIVEESAIVSTTVVTLSFPVVEVHPSAEMPGRLSKDQPPAVEGT